MKKLKSPEKLAFSHKQAEKAALIYQNARYSAASLLQAFELARASRGKPRGMTTDQEQDILRAMLVMSAAGLDASLKQIIRDALPELATREYAVQQGFEKFVRQSLAGADVESDAASGLKFLARVLSTPSPYWRAVDEYIRDLTGDSLQSAEQVLSAVAALGLDHQKMGFSIQDLKVIFKVRNQIIHELDIDLGGERRKRNIRGRDDMVGYADTLLNTTASIILGVDKKCRPPTRPFSVRPLRGRR